MKTTQEIIRLLKDFKAAHAGQYGILRMGIFGSVARRNRRKIAMWIFIMKGNCPDYLRYRILNMSWKIC